MKKSFFARFGVSLVCMLVVSMATNNVYAQAKSKSPDARVISMELNPHDQMPASVSFAPDAGFRREDAQTIFATYLGVDGSKNEMRFSNATTSKQLIITDRYDQYIGGIKVDYAGYTLTIRDNKVQFITGNAYPTVAVGSSTPSISNSDAFALALASVGAEKYMWQDPAEEARIKEMYHKPDTTFLPAGKLVWIEDFLNGNDDRKLHLAWSFDIYATKPLSRHIVYVDAGNGHILLSNSLIKHTAASGHTKYSGVVPFITSHVGTTYELFDSTRGNGVHTRNLHNTTSIAGATEFTSATNTWPAATADSQALDAHWGGEIVYDYWKTQQGRLSWDNLDGVLLQYVHYSTNYDNAFWDGAEMNYGDGSGCGGGGFTALTSLDVTAHEIGHGVCQATCNLVYSKESGAIDEGLSDCWGATIENYGDPHEVDAVSKKPWWMGEEIGCGTPLRRLDSPKLYGLPDTYLGTNWYPVTTCTPGGGNDQCGVHTNMGVISKWYYLITIGGTGTNDLANTYTVNPIGWTEAANILYQTELVLASNTTYAQLRTASINVATTLYGACSAEVQSVTNGWYAVGVGTAFVPCTPQIGFTVTSMTINEKSASTACPASTTYNIGLKPIGPAITGGNPMVTVIGAGGTAVAGVNYSISSPTITFLAGDTTTHYVTLTIFDNGAINDNNSLKLAFTLAAAGSTATISPTNDTLFININNDDKAPDAGGVEYHTLNAGTLVTSNLTSAFYGSRRRAHSQFLLNASELTAAGVRAGVPISQIGFNITTKNSTIPFTGYSISMGNTPAADLSTAFATGLTQVYSGAPTTYVGMDTLDFNVATFTWDGTSNVAVEVCFGMNAASATANDQMDGIQQGAQTVCGYNSTNTGTGTGCSLTYSAANTSTARPVMRFKQNVPPTPIETVAGSTRTWDVHAGQEVYFYNPTDTNLIAGLKNETLDLGCVTATVTQAGVGFTPASFMTFNRSKKEITITPTINTATTTYDVTIYLTNTELNAVAPGSLYLFKTDAPTDATVTTANSVELTPSLVTGSNYVGFKGTFTGFSRFFLVDGPFCTAPVAPLPAGMPAVHCSGTSAWYHVGAVATATSYTWTVSGTGWSGASTVDSINLTAGSGIATVTVAAVNSCTTGPVYSFTVNPSPLPGVPAITPPGTTPCAGATAVSYSGSATGATSYNWTVLGTGWSGSSTTGTINVNVGTGSGQIIVSGVNTCGAGTPDSLNVTPGTTPGLTTVSLAGPLPCSGATTATYNATSTGATSFNWTVSGTGWSGSSTTSSILVTLGTGTGTVICTGVNACGTGTPDTAFMTPSPLPGTPTTTLIGTVSCASTTAQYTGTSFGSTGLTWTVVGSGWSGTPSVTTDTLNVTVGSGTGMIICSGTNACGTGIADTTYLTPTSGVGPASPIMATTGVCEGSTATFITSAVSGATSYAWTVVGTGWSGTSTTTMINLVVGSGPATISVSGVGPCGVGASYTLYSVYPVVPPTASFSIANHVVGLGINDLIMYTGTASTSTGVYSWNFGGGFATPASGPGPMMVNWSSTGLKNITLTVSDSGCTSTTIFSDTVLVLTTTGLGSMGSDANNAVIVPNPGNGVFDIVFGQQISGSANVRLSDVSGRIVFNQAFENAGADKIRVTTENLPDGVYTATIVTGEQVINRKVIIAR